MIYSTLSYLAASIHLGPEMPKVLPQLKPSHPHLFEKIRYGQIEVKVAGSNKKFKDSRSNDCEVMVTEQVSLRERCLEHVLRAKKSK